MQLLISNEQQETMVSGEICSLIQDAIEDALATEPGEQISRAIAGRAVEVGITLIDDARMAVLNQQYRGIAGTTDVLSFPMLDDILEARSQEPGARKKTGAKNESMQVARATSDMELLLGDIVISAPKALAQAAAYGNSFPQEMVWLAVHGMLHLLGYDDETDEGAARMMERTRQVMDKLGLGAGRDE